MTLLADLYVEGGPYGQVLCRAFSQIGLEHVNQACEQVRWFFSGEPQVFCPT